jgi:apolipoprotein N-acyltransferase
VRQISFSAWLLALFSAILQILIFPLPHFYVLSWVAFAPLVFALLRTRPPQTLQLGGAGRMLPATPLQGFVLAYVCGVVWYAGTCYWIYATMRQYGGVNAPAAAGLLFLFCLYLALYHGAFGLLVSLLGSWQTVRRSEQPFSPRMFILAPFLWVAVELARTRITAFPWDLLGTAQVDNIPLARIATVTGVYGLSFEIMVVNCAFAAAFLVSRQKRRTMLAASVGAAIVLQAGSLIKPPALPTDHVALLVQQNIPVQEGSEWTKDFFEATLRDLAGISLHPPGAEGVHADLIAWPESPAPFYTTDPTFRDAISNVARQSGAWVVAGSLGIRNATQDPTRSTQTFNSAALVSPQGVWHGRYDKMHLVPFGEYVPFRSIFFFAGGLTQQVGDFTHGDSRAPLDAGGMKLGTFICYESVFPDEVRQFAAQGAQVLVNLSNDGWYGDSGAWAQHLAQARMRAVENGRWLLRDTNTGLTSSIDPYGRVVASVPRKLRTVLVAPYALTSVTTFYTRHGDWFAWLCAIISVAALITRFLPKRNRTTNG